MNKGHTTKFDGKMGNCSINMNSVGKRFIDTRKIGKLFVILDYQNYPNAEFADNRHAELSLLSKKSNLSIDTWHARLGHVNKDMILKLKSAVDGLDITEIKDEQELNKPCEVCITTKMKKQPFGVSTRRATKPLELVHADLMGPLRVKTKFDQHVYVLTIVDDYSRFTKVYTMKKKSDTLEKFKSYIQEVGTPNTVEVRGLRTDNGGEFIGEVFEKFCQDKSIRRELTVPRTPEQNAIAESSLRVLTEMARSMLKNANLGFEWWGRALITAAYIKNRCLTKAISSNKTPYELFTGKKPNLKHMRKFGCKVYIHNDNPNKGKLDDRGIEGIFLGYGERTKGFITYLKNADKLVLSRNVIFIEDDQTLVKKFMVLINIILILINCY
ncbi:MAG: DDE-type integrase/transposase/recombinase, partial [Rhabdochlamydiaceae bacterium]